MFVIMKGKYFVAMPGCKNSYTLDIRHAQKFATRAEAEKNKCGNEAVVSIYQIIK